MLPNATGYMLLLSLCTIPSRGAVPSTRPNVCISFQFPTGSSRHILILPAVYPLLTFLIIFKVLKAREAEVIPTYLSSALVLSTLKYIIHRKGKEWQLTLTDHNLKRLLPLHMHPICLRTPALNWALTKAPDALSLASTPAIPTTIAHLRTGTARHPR